MNKNISDSSTIYFVLSRSRSSIFISYSFQLDMLMKEHLVVEELYHQQQLSLAVLRKGSAEISQANQLSAALQQKNEGVFVW